MSKQAVWDELKKFSEERTRKANAGASQPQSERSNRRAVQNAVNAVTAAFDGDLLAGTEALTKYVNCKHSISQHSLEHADVAKEIVDSLRYKIGERLQSKGRLPDANQFAMDVIGGSLSKKALKVLGVKPKMINRLSDVPLEGPLEPMPRDAGRVELRKAMAEAIDAWCHGDDWRPDSNGRTVRIGGFRKKQAGQVASTWQDTEVHPARFFSSNDLGEQLEAFKKSDNWTTLLKKYPDAHVGKTWFRQKRCRCCKHDQGGEHRVRAFGSDALVKAGPASQSTLHRR